MNSSKRDMAFTKGDRVRVVASPYFGWETRPGQHGEVVEVAPFAGRRERGEYRVQLDHYYKPLGFMGAELGTGP